MPTWRLTIVSPPTALVYSLNTTSRCPCPSLREFGPRQSVARSSHFVDDIKRLRRAGGLVERNVAWGVAAAVTAEGGRPFRGRGKNDGGKGKAAAVVMTPLSPVDLAEQHGVPPAVVQICRASSGGKKEGAAGEEGGGAGGARGAGGGEGGASITTGLTSLSLIHI